MISELFTAQVLIGIATSGIRLATPYLYASIGESLGQRSGVLNLGVEGQMLLGAFAGFYVTFVTENAWLGLLAALTVGAVMGLLMADPSGATRDQWDWDISVWPWVERAAI